MCTPPGRLVAGLLRRAAAKWLARASWRRRSLADCSCRSAIAWAGVPKRVILNFGDVVWRMLSSLVGGNGAFCIPGFGAMRSFWLSLGMLRVLSISLDRSCSVAVDGRVKVCWVPWW